MHTFLAFRKQMNFLIDLLSSIIENHEFLRKPTYTNYIFTFHTFSLDSHLVNSLEFQPLPSIRTKIVRYFNGRITYKSQ